MNPLHNGGCGPMRFLIWLMLFASTLLLFPSVGQAKERPDVSAANAILMEASTGRVLFEKDAHEERPIASITKVMTALVAIRYGDLSDQVTISEEAANQNGSSVYLQAGEKMSLEDLLYGLMLRSGNDAAEAIAEHVGGSVDGFVFLMNETALYLGMDDTHFMNPHGLDEDGHYSSAFDMALLMQHASRNDVFADIAGTESHQAAAISYPWQNKNKLLTNLYQPCTGGKTGFTSKAGRTLVTTAEKDGESLIAVTLNGPDDWNDQVSMYEWGFDAYSLTELDHAGKQKFIHQGQSYTAYTGQEVIYPLQEKEKPQMKKEVELTNKSKTKKHQAAEQKQKVGRIRYVLAGKPIREVPLYAEPQPNSQIISFEAVLFKIAGMKRHG